MLVESLIHEEARQFAAQPEMDPLTEADALAETQVLSVHFDALTLTLALLFEMRMALQLRESNTGLLVARGVRQFHWTSDARATGKTAWNVIGSTPAADGGLFSLQLLIWPKADMAIYAESAAFYAGDVPGLDGAPPNYVEDDDQTVRSQIAGWRSEFTPNHAVFLDRSP